jgi:histidyl-tRNA synthetase
MVIVGSDEVANGVVKVKDLNAKVEATVARADLVDHLRSKIAC